MQLKIEEICSGKFEPIRISAKGELGKLIETVNKMLVVFQTKGIEAEERLNEKLFVLYELNYAVKAISFTLKINELLEIAGRLGLSSQVQEEIQLAALLHDIGKIGIPDEVLHKPDRLTDDEFTTIKTHPIQGSKIMEHIKQLSEIIPGMKHHHERFSGGGYPDGLKGEDVPLAGRIISVADAFDAMTSDRHIDRG